MGVGAEFPKGIIFRAATEESSRPSMNCPGNGRSYVRCRMPADSVRFVRSASDMGF